jgi:hypothetical protein
MRDRLSEPCKVRDTQRRRQQVLAGRPRMGQDCCGPLGQGSATCIATSAGGGAPPRDRGTGRDPSDELSGPAEPMADVVRASRGSMTSASQAPGGSTVAAGIGEVDLDTSQARGERRRRPCGRGHTAGSSTAAAAEGTRPPSRRARVGSQCSRLWPVAPAARRGRKHHRGRIEPFAAAGSRAALARRGAAAPVAADPRGRLCSKGAGERRGLPSGPTASPAGCRRPSLTLDVPGSTTQRGVDHSLW